jgi:hypothetical protein
MCREVVAVPHLSQAFLTKWSSEIDVVKPRPVVEWVVFIAWIRKNNMLWGSMSAAWARIYSRSLWLSQVIRHIQPRLEFLGNLSEITMRPGRSLGLT